MPGLLLACLSLVSSARAEQVLLSKIMYHPPGEQPEYIEIYNNTATAMDIADWRLKGGIEFRFPAFNAADSQAAWMKPFERIVISMADARTTRAAYKIPANVRILGPWIGRLNKQGDRLKLIDKNGLTMSTVKYMDHAPWPAAANGGGHALVLKYPDRKVDDWRNWGVSTKPGGGPGTESGAVNETPVGNPELITQSGETVVVDYDANWAITTGVDMTPTKWKELTFPDRTWTRGPGLIGFGTTKVPPPGIRTPVRAGFVTYYLRHVFIYNGPSGGQISVDTILDDGAVFYLNNQEVGRVGMPGGPVRANTPASRNVGDAIEEKAVFGINAAALVRGTNVLAVEVHQFPGPNPDLAFGMKLKVKAGGAALARSVLINEVFPGPTGVNFIEFFNSGATPVNLKGYYLLPAPPSALAPNARRYQVQQDLVIRSKSFGTLDMLEAGVWPKQPVVAYLVAPDGQTVLHAISAVVPTDGRSLGQRPDGSGQWFYLGQPTPDAPNAKQSGLVGSLKINEVHLGKDGVVDWVEVYNAGTNRATLGGHFLASKSGFGDKVTLVGDVPAKGLKTFAVTFPTVAGNVTIFLVGAENVVLDAHTFHLSKHGEFFSAFPEGSGEFLVDTKGTRDQPNAPARNTDIVINEIMYKPPVTQESSEFVELFNRGDKSVDLSDWVLTGGIDFIFPPNTRLKAGDYLVIAADAGLLRSVHGNINVLGNFAGKLNNEGDLLRLLDAKGNLVNEVDYRPGGDWPVLAHGGGSSMELLHPFMDNRLSSAWRDSDESGKAKFKSYYASGLYESNALLTPILPTDINELHLYLVSDGHTIVDNVQIRKNGEGPNYILNGKRMSTNGVSESGWLAQGSHWATYIKDGQLHLLSDGRGDNRANRAEIDAPNLRKGDTYELRFDAKWVAGSPRLIAHTWDYSLCPSFLIEVPANLGTPGRPNSRRQPALAAQVDNLSHSPAVPRSIDTVKVTAQVRSAGLLNVQLFHRLDNENGNGQWNSKPMGTSGDGVYSAVLPEYKTVGNVVQFYVRATTAGGECLLPRGGASLPAMFVVDDQNITRDLRLERFILSAYDIGAMLGGNTNKYNWKFPRLNNHYFNATFINNEQEIYYNAELHNSGSGYTRGGLDRGKWKLPLDRLFRDHRKLTYDNDPDGAARHHNRLVRYWLYLLGEPVNECEFVRVILNKNAPMLREETEPVSNDYLKRVWKHGTQGQLYRPEFTWWFRDDWTGGSPIPPSFEYKGSDDPRLYRHVWMKRTREAEDDYSDLTAFFKLMSDNQYTQQQIERVLDPEAVLKSAAVRGYSADWDTFTMGGTHNALFYHRTDGRFQFLHWDSDQGFQAANIPGRFYGGPIQPWLEKPYNKRLFFYYLVELLENYTLNSPRINAWMRAEVEASNAINVESKLYRDFFAGRQAAALKLMGDNYKLDFKLTTNNGQPLTTDAVSVSIEGQSPYGIFTVVIDGQPRAKLEWIDDTKWRMNNIGLSPGANELVLRGVDQWGNTKREAKLTVTKPAPPAPKSAGK